MQEDIRIEPSSPPSQDNDRPRGERGDRGGDRGGPRRGNDAPAPYKPKFAPRGVPQHRGEGPGGQSERPYNGDRPDRGPRPAPKGDFKSGPRGDFKGGFKSGPKGAYDPLNERPAPSKFKGGGGFKGPKRPKA